MRAAWIRLRETLSQIASGVNVALDDEDVARFTRLYRRHIEFEERELLPFAERLLDDDALAATGESMAQRRGVRR
jgi:hemerythrin-like domain-containing protein